MNKLASCCQKLSSFQGRLTFVFCGYLKIAYFRGKILWFLAWLSSKYYFCGFWSIFDIFWSCHHLKKSGPHFQLIRPFIINRVFITISKLQNYQDSRTWNQGHPVHHLAFIRTQPIALFSLVLSSFSHVRTHKQATRLSGLQDSAVCLYPKSHQPK